MSAPTLSAERLTTAPGDHVCAFYRGEAERREILREFLAAGLAAGAPCLCIAGDADREWLAQTLGPDLALDSYPATYTHGGAFDREHLLSYWQAWGEAHGRGTRTASDMSWAEAAFGTPVLEEFMAYEAETTALARQLDATALCLYDLERLGRHVIIPALRAHPVVLVSGVLVRNPYCEAR
ncbi:MEDS domain-containing protein [Sporichthya brevicatena]|jgi:hypothetical protein|uniref:MEDS domain-containing protein n=1 Tax=Sporichthya brevicatena TaxID=171442 RepID=A0ABN1H596_9ACTN